MKASKQQLKRLGKRGLSLFMAMTMCLSLIQISAFATADPNVVTQANKQLTGAWDGDGVGGNDRVGGTVSYTGAGTVTTGSDWAVQLSRTLEATGTENLFNVNMEIVTKDEEIQVTNADAAVVLVLDTSGSMGYCAECGSTSAKGHHTFSDTGHWYRYNHDWYWSNTPDGKCDVDDCDLTAADHYDHAFKSRLAAAQEAVSAFLDGYAEVTNPGAQRYVSLVNFYDDAYAVEFTSDSYWANVAHTVGNTDEDLDNIKTEVSSLPAGGGTNTEAGFQLAYNLLRRSELPASISNKYVIFLSDGEPTFHLNGTNSTTATSFTGTEGGGDWSKKSDWQDLKPIADRITSTSDGNAAMYSLLYGDTASAKLWQNDNKQSKNQQDETYPTVAALFNAFNKRPATDNILTPTTPDQLNTIFQNILNSQETSGSTTNGVSAAIGDLIGGTAPAYTFIGFNNADGSGLVLNGGTPATSYNGASVTGNALDWDLDNAESVSSSSTTTYTLSYQVRLNNNIQDFLDWNEFSTDPTAEYSVGDATLSYTYTPTSGTPSTPEVAFPDVKAHGYLGHFDFMKIAHHRGVDSKNNPVTIPLAGAPFQLTNLVNAPLYVAANAMTQNTTSQTDAENETLGQVEFTGIPSGYSYTLSETGEFTYNGRTYQPTDETWTVGVSYGEISGAPSGNVENTLEQLPINLTLTKTWQVPSPDSTGQILVDLKQSGTTVATLTLNGSSASTSDNTYQVAYDSIHSTATKWVYTLTVPQINQETGGNYVYTTEEHSLGDWYTTTYSLDKMSITNTTTGKTSVTVEKQWLPIDNQPMTTIPPVTVMLYRTSDNILTPQKAGEITLPTEDGSFTNTWSNLDAYDGFGQPYTYSVSEPEGEDIPYQQVGSVTGTGTAGDPFVLTNTVLAGSIDVPVSKTWNDGGNSNRPNITVELLRDGQSFSLVDGQTSTTYELTSADADASVVAGNVWTHTFTGLPEYGFTTTSGVITAVHKYQYSVKELSDVDGYTSIKDCDLNLINTRSQNVSIEVTKVWNDNFASHDEVTIQLLQNGTPINQATTVGGAATFSDLPQFDTSGDAYAYTVVEADVPSRYTPSYDYGTNNSAVVFDAEHVGHVTVTNTLQTSEEKISVDVTKVWQQPSGITPPTVTFTLYQATENGDPVELRTGELTSGTTYTFDNLPKYYDKQVPVQDGTDETDTPVYKTEVQQREYQYTVSEGAITGYTSDDGVQDKINPNHWTFTNTITGTVTLDVEKQWQDLSSTGRPTATIQLMRTDGTVDQGNLTWEEVQGKTLITSDSVNSDSWTVDKYSPTGKLYTYKVVEGTVNNYSTAYSPSNATYTQDINKVTVTNTLTQDASYNFTATKAWADNSNDQDTRKPITLTLYQLANGAETAMGTVVINENGTLVTGDGAGTYTGSVSVNNTTTANQWSIQFSNLQKYAYDGNNVYAYSYKVTEAPVDGYSTSIINNTITNTLRQSTAIITMSKNWVDPADTAHPDVVFTLDASVSGTPVTSITDANGQTVTFPQTVTLGFSGNATAPSDAAGAPVTDSTVDNWYYTWSSLPKYDDNQRRITYTVSEGSVDGYTAQAGVGYSFTNTIVQEYLDFDGQKVWNMKTNQNEGDYLNPSAQDVTIGLYYLNDDGSLGQLVSINGLSNPVSVSPVTGEDSITGTFSFQNLPRYDLSNGSELHYTVREIENTKAPDGTPGMRPIEDNSTLSLSVSDHGNSFKYNYKVGYQVVNKTPTEKKNNGTDTTVTNTYYDPEIYFYRIIGNYYTYLSGDLIHSQVGVNLSGTPEGYLTGSENDVINAVTGDYASLNGLAFQYDSGNANNVASVSLDQVNHMFTIVLNYQRNLYTLSVNYVFENEADKPISGFENYTAPNWTPPTEGQSYTDPGSYLPGDTYSGISKAAPTGFKITQVTVEDATGTSTVNSYDGGSFANHDVIVTYYYAKVVNPTPVIVNPSFTIQKVDWGTNAPITHDSADFQVYTDEGCTDENKVDGKVFSTSNGEKTVNASDLGVGTWYLKEFKAPTGYTAATTVWKVVVTRDESQYLPVGGSQYVNKVVWTVAVTLNDENALTGENNNLLVVPNTRQHGFLTITKIVSGLPQGMTRTYEFTVSGPDDFSQKLTVNADRDGTYTLEKLEVPTGAYVVTETHDSAEIGGGYSVNISYSSESGAVTVTADNDNDHAANITVTNAYHYTPSKVTISGNKVWDDDNNRDGLRPVSILVQLFHNDEPIPGATAPVDATGTFSIDYDSNQYPGTITVEEIRYTDAQGTYHEGTVPGYEVVNGTDDNNYTVTNTHTPEVVRIQASKVWNNGTQQPVTLRLNANGQAVAGAVMTLDGMVDEEYTPKLTALISSVDETYATEFTAWIGNFPGAFFKYANGKLIDYTITEDSLGSGWSCSISKSALSDGDYVYGYRFTATNSYSSGGGGSDPSYYYRTDYVYTGYGADGSQIYNDTVSGSVQTTGRDTYSFTAADTANHGGYTFSLASDADLSASLAGTSRSDPYVFTVYYEFTELTDEETPTGETPDNVTTPDEPTDIQEEAVPKANVPATGDNLALWIMAAAVSGIGLVWISLTGKKRREDENS